MPSLHPGPALRSGTDHARGLPLVAAGGLLLSFDIPLIRLSEADIWTTLAVRGVLAFAAAIAIFLIDRALWPRGQKLIPGLPGLMATSAFAVSSTTFTYAVFNTSAGNVVFLLAFNPVFAALLAWRFGGEKPPLHTFVALPLMLLGVAMIIGSGFVSGNWTGDLAALATAFFTAAGLTIARKSRADMRYASAIGVVVPALAAIPYVATVGLQSEAIGWLALNGGVTVPLALICLTLGPLFVPAPVASMGFLMETILAPLWIWWIFAERPTNLALAGGAIVILTLAGHAILDLRSVRRPRRLGNVPRV